MLVKTALLPETISTEVVCSIYHECRRQREDSPCLREATEWNAGSTAHRGLALFNRSPERCMQSPV